tara:strand:+ start:5834 stop:6007 length:174 start_codon:yes stop_codon:yes gene_type:complete
MTVEYGLLMGVLGTSITLIGFFIAYLVANNFVIKKQKKREPSPIDDLRKNIYGEDCQ